MGPGAQILKYGRCHMTRDLDENARNVKSGIGVVEVKLQFECDTGVYQNLDVPFL
jgi:hypothetical protein